MTSAAITYLLPVTTQIVRSLTIRALADRMFPHVNAVQETESLSPWQALMTEDRISVGYETDLGTSNPWLKGSDERLSC